MLFKTDIVDCCKKRIPENKQIEAKERSNHFEHKKKSNDNSIFQIILKALQRSCYGKILITDMTMKQQHKTDEMASNHIKIG